MTVADLIAKLEAATEGSRELSDAVLIHCGWTYDPYREGYAWRSPDGKWEGNHDRPDPTRSLDAAMTLVPEGWIWFRTTDGWIYVQDTTWPLESKGPAAFGAYSKSPALALCIAALKARAI